MLLFTETVLIDEKIRGKGGQFNLMFVLIARNLFNPKKIATMDPINFKIFDTRFLIGSSTFSVQLSCRRRGI